MEASCCLPPGYDGEPDRHYPSVYVIQGYTGHLAMWRNRTACRQPFPEIADAMSGRAGGWPTDPRSATRFA
jgi:hypothetical protein